MTEKEQTTSQASAPSTQAASSNRSQAGGSAGGKKTFPRQKKGGRDRREKFRPEFDQEILGIRRVTRVMAGGRRFQFSVAMVAGDRKGRVGVGVGKAGDTAAAIEKAFNNAKKNMVTLPLKNDKSIVHEVSAKYCGSKVLLMPAPGKGLVAGGAVRSVLNLAGVHDVSAKILSRSKNAINNARVTIAAFEKLPEHNGQKDHASSKKQASEKTPAS